MLYRTGISRWYLRAEACMQIAIHTALSFYHPSNGASSPAFFESQGTGFTEAMGLTALRFSWLSLVQLGEDKGRNAGGLYGVCESLKQKRGGGVFALQGPITLNLSTMCAQTMIVR